MSQRLSRLNRSLRSLIVIMLLVLCALASQACYSGLCLIPTADVLGRGQYCVSIQPSGPMNDIAATTFLNTEIGVLPNLEVGVDIDLSTGDDPKYFFNGKYAVDIRGTGGKFAIGAYNFGNSTTTTPYAVYTQPIGCFRGHVGTMKLEDVWQPFVGADFTYDKWMLMGDYTAGDDNLYSYGVNYQFTPSFGILAGAYAPNNGGETTYTMCFAFSGDVGL